MSDTTISAGGANGLITVIVMILVISIIYFIPTYVAIKERHIQKTAIIVLNIFLGWTFVGWVVALVWAVTKNNRGYHN